MGDMHPKRAPDICVAEIARQQHGAVSIGQLRSCGLSDTAVRERVRAGRLHREHQGVYGVGHIAPSDERRWMAAVLALSGAPATGSPAAVLSHRSAAELWRVLPVSDEPVDVSLLSRGGKRKRDGIRVHRPTRLAPEETTRQREIPVTSPARTLEDLRSVVPSRVMRRATGQAEFLGLPIGSEVVSDRTRSELERRFLWLCGRHHLPKAAVNLPIGEMTVDFCWVEQKLVVETDGYRSHRGRAAFEGDRARDLRLRTLGYDVLHFSYRQVFEEPERVVRLLRTTLTQTRRTR